MDGRRVDEARISIHDRGLRYGDGLFETLRTWDGAVGDLDAHLDRLYASASALELYVMERAAVAAAVEELAAGQGDEQRIRIVVTRGEGELATPRHAMRG